MADFVHDGTNTPEAASAMRYFFARDSDGPVITAAGNADSAELEGVLLRATWLPPRERSEFALDWVHDEGSPQGYWDTPLLRAINRKVLRNVELLLQNGANPNGITLRFQIEYSRRFRRFRAPTASRTYNIPVKPQDVGPARMQTFPLMEAEMSARRNNISRFWADAESPPLDRTRNGDKLHSLVMAADTTPTIFQVLLEAGADASFWTSEAALLELPPDEELKPSALCVSTPLHQAIAAGNLHMLKTILEHGFNPNAQALIAGCQAFTPIQQAVINVNIDALRELKAHPSADANICAPVFNVHAIHLAVAQLRTDLYDELKTAGMPKSPISALHHNVAHVACLPDSDIDIQLFAPKVRQSIHDIRSLDRRWRFDAIFQRTASRHTFENAPRVPQPNCDGPTGNRPVEELGVALEHRRAGPTETKWFEKPSIAHFSAQLEISKRLVADFGVSIFCQPDYCQNTALHYLASARMCNHQLVAWLRGHAEIDASWKNSKNLWVHTPQDLWMDSVTVKEIGIQHYVPRARRGLSQRQN